MKNSFRIILLIAIFSFSCEKDSEDNVTPDLGYAYAGLEVGQYVIYDVDSIFYDDFNSTIDLSLIHI